MNLMLRMNGSPVKSENNEVACLEGRGLTPSLSLWLDAL